MTRKQFYRWTSIVIAIYGAAIVVGIALRIWRPDKDDLIYATFKDLIPFLIAIPAAWLGFCFQRRASYVQQLRAFWSDLVSAIQHTVQYTFIAEPTQAQFATTMVSLTTAIDEVRGIFKNLKESPTQVGIYPFESLKEIKNAIDTLGFGSRATPAAAKATREEILHGWRRLRAQLLREFDRDCPTYVDSPFISDALEND